MSSTRAFLAEPAPGLKISRTSIFIAHRLSTIKDCDQIVVMKEGRVMESGHHDKLISKEGGIYQSMWKSQQEHKK